MIGLAAALRALTTNVGTLSGNVGTLTRKVDNFAGRGHQVAVVETVQSGCKCPSLQGHSMWTTTLWAIRRSRAFPARR